MRVEPLAIPDVFLVEPVRHADERGFFSEIFNRQAFEAAGIASSFVQDNHSLSRPRGTVRGLHFQAHPFAQAKLVRVIRGSIFDVAVDLRRSSPTYGGHVSAVLSAENWRQMLIPIGCAHGFCTLEPDTEVLYKVDNFYSREHDLGVSWCDPAIGIDWPLPPEGAILSDKDGRQPMLRDLPAYFS